MSVGVKGFRVGTGPRGHYIHAGAGGLYYRSSIGKAGQARNHVPVPKVPAGTPSSWNVDSVEMVEVDSGDVLSMRDASVDDLLDDINAKAAQTPLATMVGWAGMLLGGVFLFASASAAVAVWLAALVAWLFARWIDSYQRKAVLYYDLEPDALAAYEQLTQAFDPLMSCGGKWHIAAGGDVRDLTTWKRNAGATYIVSKKPTTLAYTLPAVIASNITPPSAQVGTQTLFFFPDVVIVGNEKKSGAVGYPDLELRWQESNFIEEGRVPPDAVVVGHTWKHPNKNGGPDRRFKDNYQIPICRYEALHLTSSSGLNELLEFSKSGLSQAFAHAIHGLGKINGRAKIPA